MLDAGRDSAIAGSSACAISTNDQRRASGGLYGGAISYAFSERTQFYVGLSESSRAERLPVP